MITFPNNSIANRVLDDEQSQPAIDVSAFKQAKQTITPSIDVNAFKQAKSGMQNPEESKVGKSYSEIFENDETYQTLQKELSDLKSGKARVPTRVGSQIAQKEREIDERKKELLMQSEIGESDLTAEELGDIGYGLDDLESAKNILKKRYNQDVEVFNIPEIDEMVYENPETGQIRLINNDGIDAGDLLQVANKYGLVAVSEIVGATAGGLLIGAGTLGSPTGIAAGGLAGGALGAAVGEYYRLKQGKERGVVNLTDTEIAIEAAKEAGLALGGGLAGGAIAKMYSKMIGLDLAKIEAATNIKDAIGEQGLKTLDAGTSANAGAVTMGASDDAVARAQAGGRETGDTATAGILQDLKNTARKSDATGRITQDTIAAQKGVRKSLDALAPDGYVDDAITDPFDKIKKDIDDADDVSFQKIDEIYQGLSKNNVDYQRKVGGAVRESLQTGRDASARYFQDLYTQFKDKALEADIRFNLTPLRVQARNLLNDSNKNIFKSLSPDDIEVFRSILSGAPKQKTKKKTLSEALGMPSKPQQAILDEVDYDVFNRALSDLNSEIRAVNKGLVKRANIKQLQEIRDNMQQIKKAAFEDNPELLDEYEAISNSYKTFKREVDGGVVGEIITKNDFGNYIVDADKVVNKILESGEKAEILGKTLMRDEFQSGGLHQQVVDLVNDYIVKEITKNDQISEAALNTLIKNKGDQIRQLVGKDSYLGYKSAVDIAKNHSQLLKGRKKFITDFKKKTGVDLEDISPDSVYTQTMKLKGKKFDDAINLLADEPKALEALKTGIKSDIRGAAIGNNKQFNQNGLTDYLANNKDRLKKVFGDDYVKDLDDLDAAIQSLFGAKPMSSFLTDSKKGTLQQALRVVFAPLSARGRAYTAAQVENNKRVNEKIVDIISNPNELQYLMKNLKTAENIVDIGRVLGALGLPMINTEEGQ